MKQQFRQVNQTLAAERQEKEDLESKNSRVQEALRLANKQSVDSRREQDSLTARIVSMEESLDIRNNKLKAAEDSIQLLRAQLNQYQHDFGNERIAREQIHQESQEKGLKLENLRKENDELKNMVQKYTEAQMQRLSSQYSNPNTTSPVSPTSPYHHGRDSMEERRGLGGGLGGGEEEEEEGRLTTIVVVNIQHGIIQ
ncbi:hypothetical protein BSL78_07844 [Apostichopus japonicus]|uniref:Uncharacterized protein n=1 Tax=Stichopus japonicus TaxID=307972 RepID=A0A2G8L4T6_STIJA|nr:hypothetical protein BSL78_07844 [Apostichopus japonicus]